MKRLIFSFLLALLWLTPTAAQWNGCTAGFCSPKASGAAPKGLQTNLGSFFSLDNTLTDSTSNVTALTNNNTVTFVSTPGTGYTANSQVANFVTASSQYLSHADATGINTAGINFSLQVWIYPTGNSLAIASKATGGFGAREYDLTRPFVTGTNDPVRFEINNGGTITTTSMTSNAWHHVVITYNNTTKAMIVYLDGASAATGTSGSSPAGTSTLNIGASAAPGNYFSGNMAGYATWRNRILSPSDVTLLYNGGAGLTYAGML